MIGDDPTEKDSEPMIPEALSRSAAPYTHVDAPFPADLPSARVQGGRRISLTAWGLAGVAGVVLWVVIIKLI